MSLFLGKIHYWLYNKIKWAEKMEDEIVVWAKDAELPVDKWLDEAISKYGEATGDEPLEDVIDTGNIHGWLQERIKSAELRQAHLVTRLVEDKPESKEDIIKLFENQGRQAAAAYEEEVNVPEDAFKALNDFIIEGMPCDRVNKVISSDDDKYSWETTACLHKQYWDTVGGDITIFYQLRDSWVKAFIEALEPGFKYSKTDGNIHEIVK